MDSEGCGHEGGRREDWMMQRRMKCDIIFVCKGGPREFLPQDTPRSPSLVSRPPLVAFFAAVKMHGGGEAWV